MTRDIEIEMASDQPWLATQHERLIFQQGAHWADYHPYWRDMEKEKPQDGQRILAYFGGGVCYPCIYQDDGKDDEWVVCFNDGEVKVTGIKVTHWLPIPPLTEKGGAE